MSKYYNNFFGTFVLLEFGMYVMMVYVGGFIVIHSLLLLEHTGV